jgi:hydroxyacylglutathione hydrolase
MRLAPYLAIIGSAQFGLSGLTDCHVYALRGPKGTVLIDSGSGTHSEPLLTNLQSEFASERVDALILTHGHLDHCGGAAALRSRTGCKIIASEWTRPILETGDEEASGLKVARRQGIYPEHAHLSPCPVDLSVGDGGRFEAGGLSFLAIRVRGHSQDSCCFLTNVNGVTAIFAGDVVFYGGILGVINAEGSGMEGYRSDLRKLAGRAIEGFFPGHGLFTLCGGQRHIDKAIEQLEKGFLPRQIGQGDLIF